MDHIFKYCVLHAMPDQRRGERVNIGVAVFLKGRIDIRFSGLPKAQALTGDRWDEEAERFSHYIQGEYGQSETPEEFITRISTVNFGIVFSNIARFSSQCGEQYDARIKDILSTLVDRPRKQRKSGNTRINTEISRAFKKANVLASGTESIAQHKVVRDFVVSKDEDLKADFALKNGIYHIAATLDLRLASVSLSSAALKAIVLDKAKDSFEGARCVGVYALPSDDDRYRPHLELLKDYAQETYNWLNPRDRLKFMRGVYDAINEVH